MNPGDAIGVVVVNYNAGPWLGRCLRALLASSVPVRIVVVDNASRDESLTRLATDVPPDAPVEILRQTENTGFARACNAGAARLDGDVLVFINPDCEVEPRCLERLRAALLSAGDVGLAGALILNPDGSEQRAARRRLPTPALALATLTGLERLGVPGVNLVGAELPDAPTEAEAVSGALLCVRRRAFDDVDGFDAGYFLHGEDLDLFARLRRAGWRLLFVPAARAVHAAGVSSLSAPLATWYHKHAGMGRFYRRHLATGYGRWLGVLVAGAIWGRWLLLLPFILLRSLRGRGRPAGAR